MSQTLDNVKSPVISNVKTRKMGSILLGIVVLLLLGFQIAKIMKPKKDKQAIEEKSQITLAEQATVLPLDTMKNQDGLSITPIQTIMIEPADIQADQQRLTSPSLAYSKNNRREGASNTAASEGGNQNQRFMHQISSQETSVVSAKMQTNMDTKILQGKVIIAVLETAVNSDLPGMLRAVVSEPIYSESGRNILFPKGTRLIGQYNSAIVAGQARVYMVWQRALTPDHLDILLNSPGIDTLGQGGVGGYVDNHFWGIFGTSMLLSVMGAGVSQLDMGQDNTYEGNIYQAEVVRSFNDTSNSILDSKTRIKPTIHIAQGTPIQVFVARDLDFSQVVAQNNPEVIIR